MLAVNFDPALVRLLREVKYFLLLGLQVRQGATDTRELLRACSRLPAGDSSSSSADCGLPSFLPVCLPPYVIRYPSLPWRSTSRWRRSGAGPATWT